MSDLTIKDITPPKSNSIPVEFETENDMLLWFNTLIHISTRLVYWTTQWENNYGSINAQKKHNWQNKMMQHLAQKNIPLVQDLQQLKIIINGNQS